MYVFFKKCDAENRATLLKSRSIKKSKCDVNIYILLSVILNLLVITNYYYHITIQLSFYDACI